jgi:hypothetical protein
MKSWSAIAVLLTAFSEQGSAAGRKVGYVTECPAGTTEASFIESSSSGVETQISGCMFRSESKIQDTHLKAISESRSHEWPALDEGGVRFAAKNKPHGFVVETVLGAGAAPVRQNLGLYFLGAKVGRWETIFPDGSKAVTNYSYVLPMNALEGSTRTAEDIKVARKGNEVEVRSSSGALIERVILNRVGLPVRSEKFSAKGQTLEAKQLFSDDENLGLTQKVFSPNGRLVQEVTFKDTSTVDREQRTYDPVTGRLIEVSAITRSAGKFKSVIKQYDPKDGSILRESSYDGQRSRGFIARRDEKGGRTILSFSGKKPTSVTLPSGLVITEDMLRALPREVFGALILEGTFKACPAANGSLPLDSLTRVSSTSVKYYSGYDAKSQAKSIGEQISSIDPTHLTLLRCIDNPSLKGSSMDMAKMGLLEQAVVKHVPVSQLQWLNADTGVAAGRQVSNQDIRATKPTQAAESAGSRSSKMWVSEEAK